MKTNTMFTALALALGLAIGSPAQAATPLPKALPAYGPDKPLPTPQVVRKTLPNGLNVWVVPRDGLPKVNVALAVLGGTAADPANTPALSKLMVGLLNEGTATRSSRDIAETLQGIGGDYRASSSDDALRISASALASHAPKLLELVADTALHPAFPASEVTLAKANAMQAIKVQQAEPSWQAGRAFNHAAFGDHPYARDSMVEATVEAATPDSLRALHEERFRPDRALLVIVGRISADEAMQLAERQFGGWKAHGEAVPATPPTKRDVAPQRLLVARDGAVQSNIRYGRPSIPASHPDYVAMVVANNILGGGFTSRIVHDIREQKGYSYSPYSDYASGRVGGATLATVDVRNDVTGATLKELERLFDSMTTQPASEEELAGAKRLVGGIYLLRNQIQGALTGTLVSNWVNNLPADFLSTYVAKTNKVTVADVQAIGRKYFAPKDQSIIIVGDPKAIDAQLKPYGTFTAFKP